jgi:hypothetical protein
MALEAESPQSHRCGTESLIQIHYTMRFVAGHSLHDPALSAVNGDAWNLRPPTEGALEMQKTNMLAFLMRWTGGGAPTIASPLGGSTMSRSNDVVRYIPDVYSA